MYECSYSNPVNAQGNTPTGSSTPFAFASSTCYAASTTIATTSDIVILPTMTAGDILIGGLLLLGMVMWMVYFIASALAPIKTWLMRRERNR